MTKPEEHGLCVFSLRRGLADTDDDEGEAINDVIVDEPPGRFGGELLRAAIGEGGGLSVMSSGDASSKVRSRDDDEGCASLPGVEV